MGSGYYTAADWSKLKASRGLGSSSNANQTFSNNTINSKYDAKYINVRESFDSEDSPESTPVIIGFDVTGSMGYLAQEIATNSLNETIMKILTEKPVSNPHMMCAAFTMPGKPLQVTQFEADIRVVEQLLEFVLGGGNPFAGDNILWYFAAKHTKTDCNDKRGKKGFLIGIGDEICGTDRNILSEAAISEMFNESVNKDITFDEALAMAQEKYEIIHITVGPDYRFGFGQSHDGWKNALPGRCAKLHQDNIDCLSDVIVAAMLLVKGVSREKIFSSIADEKKRNVVREAIEDMKIS